MSYAQTPPHCGIAGNVLLRRDVIHGFRIVSTIYTLAYLRMDYFDATINFKALTLIKTSLTCL